MLSIFINKTDNEIDNTNMMYSYVHAYLLHSQYVYAIICTLKNNVHKKLLIFAHILYLLRAQNVHDINYSMLVKLLQYIFDFIAVVVS